MIRCSFKPSKVIHFCDLQTWMHKAESIRWKTAPLFVRPHNVPKICCLWGKKIRTPSPRHVSQLQSILEIPAITVQGFLKIQDFQVIWKRTPLLYLDESFMKLMKRVCILWGWPTSSKAGKFDFGETDHQNIPSQQTFATDRETDPWGKLPGTSFWDIPISHTHISLEENQSLLQRIFKAHHLGTFRWNVHGAGALEAGTYLLSESENAGGDTTWAPSSYKLGYNPDK